MTALDDRIRSGFITAGIPQLLIDELLDTFAEAKRRFYRDDLRPSEIEGARFSEVVFRILEWITTRTYTPLGTTLPNVPTLLARLEQATSSVDSVRMHIPRTLRLIYDVRNKRDVAHLGDGIDPNQQDATLVIRNMEWVLAELVRLFHNVAPEEAHSIIIELVSKEVPLIQVFDGFPRILKDLRASDHLLVLLYWRGSNGASLRELDSWVRPAMRSNLKRTLAALDAKNLVHTSNDNFTLTHLGERAVEERKILEPQ